MKIDYSVMHKNLRICLSTGETLYGKAYCDGQEGYVVYEMFGGRRREIPAVAISGYAAVREEDLGVKVRRYEDMERIYGEDPAFHMRVLDFALDILSETLGEKREGVGEDSFPREEAEKEARRSLTGREDV
ncbi:MAG: hypothetical protein LUD72_08820 [Bacteroidales bacterium]|nr:hypothetical protein [Bacteroidales bacterium]